MKEKKLLNLDCSDKIEKKNKLSYMSWSWAWSEILKNKPKATYEIKKFENNLPYVYDEKTGYMVFTSVTIDGLTHEMWLPVMDGANKAMKAHSYTYKVKEYIDRKPTGKFIDKNVEAATMFDINKTIMRCLVKNLAMFGLGLHIYSGEDLPEEEPIDISKEEKQLQSCKTVDELGKLYTSLPKDKQKMLAKFVTELKLELQKDGSK